MKRIEAYEANGQDKQSLFYEINEYIRDQMDRLVDSKPPNEDIVARTKGGLVFKAPISDGFVYLIRPETAMLPVGGISVHRAKGRSYLQVGNSALTPAFQGKGLGALMYHAMIKDLKVVASADNLSPGSSAVWRALAKTYKVTYIIPAAYSPTKKDFEMSILDWEVKGKMTYPVLQTDRGPTPLYKLSAVKTTERPSQSVKAASNGYFLVRT